MHSRCSHCNSWQLVTAAQLRLGRGLLVCSTCAEYFDALVSLSDEAEGEVEIVESGLDGLLSESGAKSFGGIWKTTLVLGFLILLLQIWYFESPKLLIQPNLRSFLVAVCEHLHCQVPHYKNPASCMVLQSDLSNGSDGGLRFSAAIINKSAWPQPYPALNLILLDLNGHPIAQRVFSPHEYAHAGALPIDEAEEISMIIVPPGGVKIGGYTIALL
jgi:predicted Zn finger-like uncharacterized protein